MSGGDFSSEGRDAARRLVPPRALIPNAITTLALCFGLSGIRFAISGNWEKAVAAIIIAAVLDMADGWVARLVKGTSRFGAELDSLSDIVAFGVAPAVIIYLWALHGLHGVGWVVALSHTVCCALRLARFNAQFDMDDLPHRRAGFLTGVPAPAGAGLALSPIFLDLWLETSLFRTPAVAAVITAASALLMVSTLPTFSWRAIRLKRQWHIALLVIVGLFAASLFSAPWGTLSLLALGYAVSLPLAHRRYRQLAAPAQEAGQRLDQADMDMPAHRPPPADPVSATAAAPGPAPATQPPSATG